MKKETIVLSLLFCMLAGCWKVNRAELALDAAERGDVIKLQSLIRQGVDLDQSSDRKFGWTPLMAAIFHNQTNAVRLLVDSGANVNLRAKNGQTPLMMAVMQGDDGLPIVLYLLEHGANSNMKDFAGDTALHYAQSHPKVLAVLENLQQTE